MDSPKRKTDQAFERKLRERFEDFQAPEKDGLSEKIFGSIGIKPRRNRWPALVVMVFLLLLGLRAGIHFNNKHIPARKMALSKAKPGSSHSEDAPAPGKTREQMPAKYSRSEDYQREQTSEKVASSRNAKSAEATISVADPNGSADSGHADFNVDMLSGRDLHFGQLALPAMIFKDSGQANTQPAKPKRSPFIPVFSMTGGQQFQIVNVHSDPELPFQNIQFAPLLSVRSMSYKVSAGIEKGGFQLLLTYGSMRTWNYYEVGTNRIEISPTHADQYVQRRDGMPRTIDEKVHLLGLSAKTALPLSRTPFRGMTTMAGLELTTVLPDPAMMLWANIQSLKSIPLSKTTHLAIGPYAEYSFSQRSFIGGRWQSRPYRIGVTAEIKFTGK